MCLRAFVDANTMERMRLGMTKITFSICIDEKDYDVSFGSF